MATSSTWMLSLKVLLISTGVVSIAMATKFSVPLMIDFAVYQVPVLWSTVLSWLKPPYLYVVINGIIITIAASSRFHQKLDHGSDNQPEQPLISAIPPSPPSDFAAVAAQPEFGVVEPISAAYESGVRVSEVKDVAEVRDEVDEFVISRSAWTPLQRINSSEIQNENISPVMEKPLVSSRFGHRKPVKSSPEGGSGSGSGRALRVAKAKRRQETLENTWKTITDGRHIPLTRHLKKCDTWDTHGRQNIDQPMVLKSETFKDRTNNYNNNPPPSSSSSSNTSSPAGSGKLRKEPSLSQDELNRRVEAFIRKFNEEMRLQRQESLNQYVEMINRGAH